MAKGPGGRAQSGLPAESPLAPSIGTPRTGGVRSLTPGRPIAALRDGDIITLDIPNRRLEVDIPDGEMQERLRACTPPPPTHTTGALAKYAKLVSSASIGAVTT